MTPKQKLIQKLQEFVGEDRSVDLRATTPQNDVLYNIAIAQLRDKIPNLVDEIENIIKSHTLNILKAEVERLVVELQNNIETQDEPVKASGYRQALQDQITRLNQEISKIEEI